MKLRIVSKLSSLKHLMNYNKNILIDKIGLFISISSYNMFLKFISKKKALTKNISKYLLKKFFKL